MSARETPTSPITSEIRDVEGWFQLASGACQNPGDQKPEPRDILEFETAPCYIRSIVEALNTFRCRVPDRAKGWLG